MLECLYPGGTCHNDYVGVCRLSYYDYVGEYRLPYDYVGGYILVQKSPIKSYRAIQYLQNELLTSILCKIEPDL